MKPYHHLYVSVLSVHSLWLVLHVQRNRQPIGQTSGESPTWWFEQNQSNFIYINLSCHRVFYDCLPWFSLKLISQIPPAAGRCRWNFELHYIWGGRSLQKTKLWVQHLKQIPFLFAYVHFEADLLNFSGYNVLHLNVGSPTSCWVKLNLEAMKREYQVVQSKRVALGKIDRAGCLLLYLLHNDNVAICI